MSNLERIQQEYDRIQAILAWDTVTEDDLLSMEFSDDASFVQFTGRMGNNFVHGRLTRDRGGNVSINIDHTMLPCELHDELRALQLNAGRIVLAANANTSSEQEAFERGYIAANSGWIDSHAAWLAYLNDED